MSFRFPLQRILMLREQREQALAREHAEARAAADDERRAHDELMATRETAAAQVAAESSMSATVGHLVSLTFALTQLRERVNAARERTEAAEAIEKRSHAALTSAAQDRQILDRLRTKRMEAYLAEESLKDRRSVDEIAGSRHHRASNANKERDPSTPESQEPVS